jgi:hypothetical protein
LGINPESHARTISEGWDFKTRILALVWHISIMRFKTICSAKRTEHMSKLTSRVEKPRKLLEEYVPLNEEFQNGMRTSNVY